MPRQFPALAQQMITKMKDGAASKAGGVSSY